MDPGEESTEISISDRRWDTFWLRQKVSISKDSVLWYQLSRCLPDV